MGESAKTAIIIGAGPAGLTAAYELQSRTDYKPVILEATDMVGGISRTVTYKGNRMDIGGHRFFSKSDRVMDWWLSFLPLQALDEGSDLEITYHRRSRLVSTPDKPGPDPAQEDRVMLVRNRLSRIIYLRKFFDYPIRLNWKTVKNLGFLRMIGIARSYIYIRLFPIRPELNLEDFFINRFGKMLYLTFFKDYTEKVWGVPCTEIKPEWGSQRVKGLSVSKALWHALRSIVPRDASVRQKRVETSLIDRFLYPKFGPGQLWETVCERVVDQGGELFYNQPVVGIQRDDSGITAVETQDPKTGERKIYRGDLFFSTMPVKDLIQGLQPAAPDLVQNLAGGLIYRDFIAVGVLLEKLCVGSSKASGTVSDNWIYVQESDVKVGRIQVFNNWSPYMVKEPGQVWLGLEYFCNEGDELWTMPDADLLSLAVSELEKINMARASDFLDGVVVRMPKTYPAYFGTYDRFDEIRSFTDQISNLFLIGRNGMHKYNNQDHSMLTAMTAVDTLVAGTTSRDSIWAVNTEEDYHEEDLNRD